MNGELAPVDAAVANMASCDAQHLGGVLARIDALATPPQVANENARECSNQAHVGTSTPARIPRAGQSISARITPCGARARPASLLRAGM